MDKRNRDRAIKVAAEIETLRAQLARLEEEFDQLTSGGRSNVSAAPVERLTLAADIEKAALEKVGPTGAFSIEDVMSWLNYEQARRSSVATTMARLEKLGRLARLSRGNYQLTELAANAKALAAE